MKTSFRWSPIIRVLMVCFLGLSIYGIIAYIRKGVFPSDIFGGLLPYVIGFLFFLSNLRPTFLLIFSMCTDIADRALLNEFQRRLVRDPLNSDNHLSIGILMMRLMSSSLHQTKMSLGWDDPKKHVRWLDHRITKSLKQLPLALQAIDNAYRLDRNGILARKGGTFAQIQITPRREGMAQASLAHFKMFFPQEVEKDAENQPGRALLEAWYGITAAIWFNPLSAEAYVAGSRLATFLHREELAAAFQTIGMRIV